MRKLSPHQSFEPCLQVFHKYHCIVISAIIFKSETKCNSGFSIGGHLLSNLSNANDIAAISGSCQELQAFLNCLTKYFAEVGLFINISKTKYMTTDKSDQPLHLTIYGKPIVQVSEFIYLVHKLSAPNDGTAAVKNIIGLLWAAFEKNKEMLTSKRIPYNIKAKDYNTYVLPVVPYGLKCVNCISSYVRLLRPSKTKLRDS